MTPYFCNNNITLYNDDCNNILPQLKENSCDVCIMDPPYCGIIDKQWDTFSSLDEYLKWIKSVFVNINRIMNNNSSLFSFTSRQLNKYINIVLDEFLEERRIIIWARKRGFNNTRGKCLASGYEPISYYVKGNPIFNNLKIQSTSNRKEYIEGILKDGICLSDVQTDITALSHNAYQKTFHPTQKPLKLIERIVLLSTNENSILIDPFAGSDTLGEVCMKHNRKCVLIEKNQEYCNLIVNRLQKESENENNNGNRINLEK